MNAYVYTCINTYMHVLISVHIEGLFITNLSKCHNNKKSCFTWYLKFSHLYFWKLIFSGMWRYTVCPYLILFDARLSVSFPLKKETNIEPHYVYIIFVRQCFELSYFEIPKNICWCRVCCYNSDRTVNTSVVGSYTNISINLPTECHFL